MKTILRTLAISMLILSSSILGYSATSGIVEVKVTIEKDVSIDIGGGPVNFGKLGVGQTAVSTAPVTVTNNGSGADEKITLSVADPAGWTQGVPGMNIYRMSFQVSADGQGAVWKSAAEISETLAYNETKKLWVKLETPTATNVTTEQAIRVTISAE